MNQLDHDDDARTENGMRQTTDDGSGEVTQEVPYIAKLVPQPARDDFGASGEVPVRIGSPFRQDPPNLGTSLQSNAQVALSGEAAYGQFGPFLYTAMGASAAAVVVLLFAIAGAWWFPVGGALVAVLGTTLSILGLFSTRRFRYAALAALPLHMLLFFFSYARTLA